MSFYTRIILACIILVSITGLVIWRGPQVQDVTLVAQSPNGETVPAGESIRITFSRAVDRSSAEAQFTLTPAVSGRFFWEGQTMTFQPDRMLASTTVYQVTIAPGLRDTQGRANKHAIRWSFCTRSPLLLLVEGSPGAASTLWLADANGKNARAIHTEEQGISDVVVAPDGRQALYVTPREPQRTVLMLINLESRITRVLMDDAQASIQHPAWSPRGDVIAYERANLSDPAVESPQIWLVQPDGTSLGPLYGNQNVSYAPIWSPDGNLLAFRNSIAQTIEIYNLRDFTTAQHVFPNATSDPVSWSPDSTALVYSSTPSQNDQPRVRRGNWQTGAISDLTDGTYADHNPAWSPSGEWIAFSRQAEQAEEQHIWVMRSDGSMARPLTSSSPYQDTRPVWSPDSQHIAFIRSSSTGTSNVWVGDRAGGEPWLVRETAAQMVWVP